MERGFIHRSEVGGRAPRAEKGNIAVQIGEGVGKVKYQLAGMNTIFTPPPTVLTTSSLSVDQLLTRIPIGLLPLTLFLYFS